MELKVVAKYYDLILAVIFKHKHPEQFIRSVVKRSVVLIYRASSLRACDHCFYSFPIFPNFCLDDLYATLRLGKLSAIEISRGFMDKAHNCEGAYYNYHGWLRVIARFITHLASLIKNALSQTRYSKCTTYYQST